MKTKIPKKFTFIGILFIALNLIVFQNCTAIKTALFVSAPEKAYAMAVGSQPGADTGGPTNGDFGGGTSDDCGACDSSSNNGPAFTAEQLADILAPAVDRRPARNELPH